MKRRPLFLSAVFLALLAGCRTDPALTLLERENRLQEDEIYRLRRVIRVYESGCAPGMGGMMVESTRSAPAPFIEDDESPLPSRRARSSDSVHPAIDPEVQLGEPGTEVPEIIRRPAGSRAAPASPAESLELAPPAPGPRRAIPRKRGPPMRRSSRMPKT